MAINTSIIFENDNNVVIELIDHDFSNSFRKRNEKEVMFRKINTYLIKNKIIDGNIIDLGAWIGDNSLPWAMNLNQTVYAIDPSPNNINYIEKMKSKNNITNIKTIKRAISNKNEKLCTDQNLNHCSFNKETGKTIVQAVSLDYLYSNNEINNIAYIHLDVEGFEQNVINGSNEIIKNFKPIISFEQHLKKDNYKELSMHLHKKGYNIYLINEILPGCNIDCRNLFAFPNDMNIPINKIHDSIGENVLLSTLNWNIKNKSCNLVFKGTLYGRHFNNAVFHDVNSFEYNGIYIFCVNHNNHTKIVAIDNNKKWLASKALLGEINILCKETVINAYLTAQIKKDKIDYNIKNINKSR